jgi:hypothetical protein
MPRPEIQSELCDEIKKSGLNVYLGRIYKSGYEFLDIKLAEQAIKRFEDIFSKNCTDILSKSRADIIIRPDYDGQMPEDIEEVRRQLKALLQPVWDPDDVGFYTKGIKDFMKKGRPKFVIIYTMVEENKRNYVIGYARALPKYQLEGRKGFKKYLLAFSGKKTIGNVAELKDNIVIDDVYDFFFLGEKREEIILIPVEEQSYKNYQRILMIQEEGREIANQILENKHITQFIRNLGYDLNQIDADRRNQIIKIIASKYGRFLHKRLINELNKMEYRDFENKMKDAISEIKRYGVKINIDIDNKGNLVWKGDRNNEQKVIEDIFSVILTYGKTYITGIPMKGWPFYS